MPKLSAVRVLLVASLLTVGATCPGASAHPATMDGRANLHAASILQRVRPSPPLDVCLTLLLAGGSIALRLRRTQRSVRAMRVAI